MTVLFSQQQSTDLQRVPGKIASTGRELQTP